MVTATEVNAHQSASVPANGLLPGSLSLGSIEVRLASGKHDIEAAQELRYRVFYEEMGAKPSQETAILKLDRDAFDEQAEHLLVVDHSRGGLVVGTYRLLRRKLSENTGGYYTSREYDISKLTNAKGEILELGRSCVDREFRSRATMSLLWQGLAAYAFEHKIQLMFGCASLPGCDPLAHGEALSYLHHSHLAPEELRPRALPDHYVDMNFLPKADIDEKRAAAALPPLIKGYLRLGGWVGDGAVIDEQFNTTDVCIVVRMESLAGRYFRHYERTARGMRLQ
jgi:putative hemolysin